MEVHDQMAVAPQEVPLEVVLEWVHLLERVTEVVLLPMEGTWGMGGEVPLTWVGLPLIRETVPATTGVLPPAVVSC